MLPATPRPLAVRMVVAALAALVAVTASIALASPAAADTATDEARMYQLTNESRAANGRGALAYDGAASGVARAWAVELARSNNLRHNPNLVAQVDAQVTRSWTAIGENVGYAGGVDQMQQAYMASAGHRNNILGNYNRVGVGAARGG
ncbi:MAG: CAP domain-containing protein, partial [Acidimicrobiia bacterium]|nr:CAP domain-containing protein [Acidimicrobiia bacterium]